MALLIALLLLAQDGLEKKIDDLLPRLAADRVEERAAAQAELRRLAEADPRAARPILKSRIASVGDAEARGALKAALAALPPFDLDAKAGEAKLDRPLTLALTIRNASDEERTVVRALDGSDSGSRYPLIQIQITGPDGKREDRPLPKRELDLAPIEPRDFIRLAPGGELILLGDGAPAHGTLKAWRPARAGRYSIRITVDFGDPNLGNWMGTAAMQDEYFRKLETLLKAVPKVKLEARIDLDVK